METHIQQLFRYIANEKRLTSSDPVSLAYEEYEWIVKKLPAAHKKLIQVAHVIDIYDKGQIKAAKAQLPAARKEYSEILSAVHDNSQSSYKLPRESVGSIGDRPERRNRNQDIDRNQEAVQGLSNQSITDPSDLQRPTKIAERYRELYDNEWMDAYDALLKKGQGEVSIIKCLLAIILNAYHTCKEESELQLKILEDAVVCVLKQGKLDEKLDSMKGHKSDVSQSHSMDRSQLVLYRKAGAALAIPRIQQRFLKVALKSPDNGLPAVRKYAEKCVEACWWMAVQDPPIEMYDEETRRFDMNIYKPYTVQSDTIAFLVWPALLLQVKGPVLARGVAQGK